MAEREPMPDTPPSLTDIEHQVIALFVRVAGLLNLPRSVGEIYGLLYVADRPLCLGDCMARLQLSKGAVSQGLRILRSFGAIRSSYVPGERRDFYLAETELRRMTAGFIAEQVRPQLQAARDQLDHIETLIGNDGHPDRLSARITQLRKWESRAARLIPLIQRVVGPAPAP